MTRPTSSQILAAENRIQELRTQLQKIKIDALLVTDLSSIRYLIGFSGSTGILVVTKKNVHFFTNDLYAVQIQTELFKIKGLKSYITRDAWAAWKENKIGTGLKTLGFNASAVSVSLHRAIKKAVSPVQMVEASELLSPITSVKTNSEIKSISQAAKIVSAAYESMLSVVKPGMTEMEVAHYLAAKSRELGSEKDAFDIIVVGGIRSAMPHGRASRAKLTKGMVVTVDFGCCVNGFYSDMTRTFCIGKPTKDIVETFAVLLDAHLTALDAARAGVKAASLDAAARDIIERAGLGDYFKHSLGHGLGYDVHESPRISGANKNEVLKENQVITIEPGIYIPGKFGMRIEDDVVLRKNGCTILTTAPRELVLV